MDQSLAWPHSWIAPRDMGGFTGPPVTLVMHASRHNRSVSKGFQNIFSNVVVIFVKISVLFKC